MYPESNPSSIPTLLRDLRDETTTLLRQEVALARTEVVESVSRTGKQLARLAVGALVAYAGAIVALIGLGHLLGAWFIHLGMAPGIATWAAPTAVGLAVVLIGWAMLGRARQALAHLDFSPRETLGSLRDNKEWAARKLHAQS
ncbi:MAG TPA: phage holin family protein [Opitutaceae bacterium]